MAIWLVRTLLVLTAAVAAAPVAEAQLPFFKKKKKPPPPAEAPAPQAVATPAPDSQAPAKVTPGAQPVVNPGQATDSQPATTPMTQGAPQGSGLSPADQATFDSLLRVARALEARTDPTVDSIRERLGIWRLAATYNPSDLGVQSGLKNAQDDLARAEARALAAGAQDQNTQNVIRSHLADVRKALDGGDWRAAERSRSQVENLQPGNIEAASFRDEIQRVKRRQELRQLAIIGLGALVMLSAFAILVGRWGGKIKEQREKKREEQAARRAAVLQIVDGIGRGRLVTLDKEKVIFRVGAAATNSDGEKNDLIISDSASLVSRDHCILVRKDGRYFLQDTSTNGTQLNGEPAGQGEHQLLEDGDEITLAEVSRLKFLHI